MILIRDRPWSKFLRLNITSLEQVVQVAQGCKWSLLDVEAQGYVASD